MRPYFLDCIKSRTQPEPHPLHTYIRSHSSTGQYKTFKASDYATIYNFPPMPSTPVTIAIVSFGGGLYGSYNSTTRILTNGDVQKYWTTICGIPAASCPRVMIVPIGGAVNTPTASGTDENTLDIITIGACYPSNKVTIVMYLAQNSAQGFQAAMSMAVNGNTIGRERIKPAVISCSWGLAEEWWEIYDKYGRKIQTYKQVCGSINAIFKKAVDTGVIICCASGDFGSGNGKPGNNVDFPASSPNVIGCGGTTLICPDLKWNKNTVETVWNNGPTSATGGGISEVFPQPAYQSAAIKNTMRTVPDIAMNADPKTGVSFLVGGKMYVFGGTSIVAPAMAAFAARCLPKKCTVASLYAASNSCFNDITVGNNGAYNAGIKYDMCTGRGSLIGTALCSALPGQIVYKNYLNQHSAPLLNQHSAPFTGYYTHHFSTIYNYPLVPANAPPITIGIISAGGGLFGTYDPKTGILTNSDAHKYWTTLCGMSLSDCPRIIIKNADTRRFFTRADLSFRALTGMSRKSTHENTLDVTTIGSNYRSSTLTIVVYISPSQSLLNAFNCAIKDTVTPPKVLSCSWGATEASMRNLCPRFEALFRSAPHIINCVASGDYGSTNLSVSYPASSPQVIACGGTTLICPNLKYDSATKETAWNSDISAGYIVASGGGVSMFYLQPNYQKSIASLNGKRRALPDIAMNGDPATGFHLYVNGSLIGLCGGTSVVAPAMAALVGLCMANGKRCTVSALYSAYAKSRSGFRDIVTGSNGHYNAEVGFDMCSGLGSLNGVELLKHL